MPSNHLILCRPLFLLLSIVPSNSAFSNESTLHIRCPKYWSFSFSISPSNEYSGFPLGLTSLISLQSKELSRVVSNTTVQMHQFFVSCSATSNSLQPYGLLCPWNFPGKNTGVGCYSLLQGILLTQRSNPSIAMYILEMGRENQDEGWDHIC